MKAGSSSSLSKMIEVVEWSDGGGSGGSGRQAQEVAAADQPSPPSILPSSRPPLPNSSAPSLHKEVPIGYSINVGEIEDDEDLIKVVVAAASGDDQTGDISGDRSSGRPASSVHRFIDSSQVLIQQRHLFDLARRHRNDFISNNNHNNMRPGSQSNFSDMYDVDDDSQYYYHDNKDKLSLKKKSGFWRKIAGYLAQQPLWKLDGARVALPGDFHFPQSPISLPSTGPDQDRDYSSIQQQHSLFLDVVFAIFLNRTTDVLRASPITLSTIGRFFMVFIPIYTTWSMSVVDYDFYFARNDLLNVIYSVLRVAFGLGLAWGGPSAFESADSSWNVLFIHIILLRVLYFAVLVVYAVKNSKHSSSLLTRAAFIVITCIPYTIAFFVALFPVRNALWVLSIVLEQVSPIIEAILAAKLRWGQLAPVPMNVLRVRLGNLGTFIVTFMLVNLFQRKIGIPDSFGAINYTFMPYICALMSILIYFALQRISINSTMMTFRLKKRPPLVHQPETFNGALHENLQQQLRQNISSDSLNSPPPPPTPAATTKVGKSNKMYTASDVNLRLITYIWRWCHVPFHACISLTCVVLQIMLENMNVLDLYSSSAFTQSPPTSQVPFWSHVQTNLNGVINNIDTTVTNTSKVAAILAASYQSFLTNGNPLVGSSSSLIEDTSDSVGKWSPPIYFCAFLSASLLMSILVLGFSAFLDRSYGGRLFWIRITCRLAMSIIAIAFSAAQANSLITLFTIGAGMMLCLLMDDLIHVIIASKLALLSK